ncbi:MAG TPA: hypothetical protein VFU47_14345, partial [Armatimonadota bacterium]|nr:hypothetical protein [Armatimonadota bacterium]
MTTPNDPFVTPSSGFEDLRNYKEHAMIVTPLRIVSGLTTKKSKEPGDTTAADVNAVILYPDGTVKELTNVRVFGKGLVGQFSRAINQMVL